MRERERERGRGRGRRKEREREMKQKEKKSVSACAPLSEKEMEKVIMTIVCSSGCVCSWIHSDNITALMIVQWQEP